MVVPYLTIDNSKTHNKGLVVEGLRKVYKSKIVLMDFSISLKKGEEFKNTGTDDLSFLFSANKGGSYGELKKVASGGELSRIMLTIKAILVKYENLPTMMFDEIDTGVSGEISNRMGEIMKEMSKSMQVFSITHLPQVASKGDQHYKVYKTEEGDGTQTQMKRLLITTGYWK